MALHEFVRSIIFGDYHYYDSAISPIANVFDISAPDSREHFLLPIVLAHVARLGVVVHQDGYVDVSAILTLAQRSDSCPPRPSLPYATLLASVSYKCIQQATRHQGGIELPQWVAYTSQRLMGSFVYLDAVVVDTPIVDVSVVDRIKDCRDIEERVERAQLFRAYLDTQWQTFDGRDLAFSWPEVSEQLESDFRRIDHALAQEH